MEGRDRRPARESDITWPFGRPRHAEYARRIELGTQHRGETARPGVGVLGADRKHGILELKTGLVADIERRMGVEYLQAGEQQEEQADRPDPVGNARPGRLAVDERPCFGGPLSRQLVDHSLGPRVHARNLHHAARQSFYARPHVRSYVELRQFVTSGFLTFA